MFQRKRKLKNTVLRKRTDVLETLIFFFCERRFLEMLEQPVLDGLDDL